MKYKYKPWYFAVLKKLVTGAKALIKNDLASASDLSLGLGGGLGDLSVDSSSAEDTAIEVREEVTLTSLFFSSSLVDDELVLASELGDLLLLCNDALLETFCNWGNFDPDEWLLWYEGQLARFSETSVASDAWTSVSDSAELAELLLLPTFFFPPPSVLMFSTDFLKSLFVALMECSEVDLELSLLGICGGRFCLGGEIFVLGGDFFSWLRLLFELFLEILFGLESPFFFCLSFGLENFMSKKELHGVADVLDAPETLEFFASSTRSDWTSFSTPIRFFGRVIFFSTILAISLRRALAMLLAVAPGEVLLVTVFTVSISIALSFCVGSGVLPPWSSGATDEHRLVGRLALSCSCCTCSAFNNSRFFLSASWDLIDDGLEYAV
jgi:hypothetical protein